MHSNSYVPPEFGLASQASSGQMKTSDCKNIDATVARALGLSESATLATKEFNFGAVVLKNSNGTIDFGRVDRANVSVTQVTDPNGSLRAWFTVDAATTSLGWFTQAPRPIWRWSFRDGSNNETISADIDSFEGNPIYSFEGFRMQCGWVAFNTFAVHNLPPGPWFNNLRSLNYLINGTFHRCP